jgi:hypothetical protein
MVSKLLVVPSSCDTVILYFYNVMFTRTIQKCMMESRGWKFLEILPLIVEIKNLIYQKSLPSLFSLCHKYKRSGCQK